MGFLDDLKRQADALKSEMSQDTATLARHAAAVEAACQATWTYWLELAPQLNVLQMRPKVRFSIDNRTPIEDLVRCDFRVDARRKPLRQQEVFDHVVLHGLQKSGRMLTLSKDFPPEIERLESRLRQAGISADVTTVRNPDNGSLREVRYTFLADIVTLVRLVPDHDAGTVTFHVMNLDGLETLKATFEATRVDADLLDELARWLTGEPHAFLKQATRREMVEA